ncbi:hypothetical protein JMJ55_17900 [Belnapia sp. T6]|uniref:Uncharacterized protein n=1 Tax=Belnapia mucosa TaxID=2804532 RepID=A0ABS1V6A2_9PROT|nr:hypothetical protein [Belnapia mucosa]MBL6457214.1 hypothetical protein [Belnapia mucosa]
MSDTTPTLLKLQPIEKRTEVAALFETWRSALATDERFRGGRNTFKPAAGSAPEAVKGGFEWRTTLRPTGLPAGLDIIIRLGDVSASYTPLDRNGSGAFGRDPTDGATYALRQWHDSKRIGSRPLKEETLAQYAAPQSAELFHAASQGNAGRGRLYLVLARLDGPPAEIAQQTFEALSGFHRVAAAAREDAW